MSTADTFPFFSIIVIVNDKTVNLLSFTLDALLAQAFEDYEVLIIKEGVKNQGLFHDYKARVDGIYPALDKNIYAMMNQGIILAKGKYIHFLQAGESYLSRHVLAFISHYITSCSGADLIYSGYIVHHSLSAPEIQFKEVEIEDLKGGGIGKSMHPYWFNKKSLVALGQLNEHYEVQAGFDLICRYFRAKEMHKIFVRRILVDYEYRRPPPQKILRQYWETLLIICKHFGLNKALLWWLAQNHLKLFLWSLQTIKGIFWRKKRIT